MANEMKNMDDGGAIDFIPGTLLNLFHHEHFGFDKKSNSICLNENPYGNPTFAPILDFKIESNGFSFLKNGRKRRTICTDRTQTEAVITEYLINLIEKFDDDLSYYTGFRTEWRKFGFNSLKFISWKNGFSSDFITFERGDDGIIYFGNPPLVDKIEVTNFFLESTELRFNTSRGVVSYNWSMEPLSLDFLRKYIAT